MILSFFTGQQYYNIVGLLLFSLLFPLAGLTVGAGLVEVVINV